MSETDARTEANARRDQAPAKPTGLGARSWGGALKRTVKEFREDKLTDWAAALTYYGVLSIFPALLVLVSILGLVGQSATQPLLENVGKFAPGAAKDVVTSAVQNLQQSQGTAGIAFVAGLAGALWAASGYIGAFMRASNVVWDVEEGRPIWKTIPLRLGLTLLMLILLAVSALAVVLTGPLAQRVGDLIGIGDVVVTVSDIAKWPVLVLIVSLMFALLSAPAGLPLGVAGRDPRRLALDPGVGGLRLLRRQLRLLRQDLRDPRRDRRPADVAVDHQSRDPLRP